MLCDPKKKETGESPKETNERQRTKQSMQPATAKISS
jgi:hypothetical protein